MPVIAQGPDSIQRAALTLRAGGVVAFATETVYGLGADTFNPAAIQRVYDLKGRPYVNPLIAHVLDIDQARRVAVHWDEQCESLAHRFWPGPLTLVVPKHESVPSRATAGFSTIAVRSPSHEVARRLLKEFGGPLSAPSANRSGHVSPTTAQHVAEDFADLEDLLILDGGPCEIGIESTVLDLSRGEPRILRPGRVSGEAIGAALGSHVSTIESRAQIESPGTSLQHYAPRTRAELVDLVGLMRRVSQASEPIAILALSAAQVPRGHVLLKMPSDADTYAAALYESLRRADHSNVSLILIETPPGKGAMWDAIRNRLQRAASGA